MKTPANPVITQLGRRPVIDYLTKDYEGFREAMLAMIPTRLPEWTDRSERDFGVVLVELVAYVADLLSYYQDRVANEAYLGTATQRRSVTELLRLIDYQIDPGLSATALVHLDVRTDLDVPLAELPYRVKTEGIPGSPDRVFEVTRPFSARSDNNAIAITGALVAGDSSTRLPRARHRLGRGDVVYLEERTDVPGGAPIVRRSGPLTIVDIRDVATDLDEVSWLPPLTGGFDPSKTVLRGNNVAATHGETVTDEPVYVGDGTPGQQMRLTRGPVTHVLAPRGSRRRRRSRADVEVRVGGVLWEEVETFFSSGPLDTHYTVSIDENDRLTVRFGTGQRGMVVPAATEVQARYRVGLGRAGNVGSDRITVAVTSRPAVGSVSNPFAAEGGADRETIEEAKISGPGSVIAQERAVTLQDHEVLAEGFAGVGKARARVGLRGGYKVVHVYVSPEAPATVPPPLPSAELKEALKQELESRQPVNRMAGVDVLDPTYVPVDIAVDVHVKADASASGVQAAVRAALDALLAYEAVDFGTSIRVGDVYTALHPIAGIAYVQLRRLARTGQPASNTATCGLDDLSIAEHELPYRGLLTIATFGGGP